MGLRPHGTKVVICMRLDDIKLSPLASIDLFHPITGYCHVTAWWFVLVFAFCVCGFLFWFFVVLFAGVLCCFLLSHDRDST